MYFPYFLYVLHKQCVYAYVLLVDWLKLVNLKLHLGEKLIFLQINCCYFKIVPFFTLQVKCPVTLFKNSPTPNILFFSHFKIVQVHMKRVFLAVHERERGDGGDGLWVEAGGVLSFSAFLRNAARACFKIHE